MGFKVPRLKCTFTDLTASGLPDKLQQPNSYNEQCDEEAEKDSNQTFARIRALLL